MGVRFWSTARFVSHMVKHTIRNWTIHRFSNGAAQCDTSWLLASECHRMAFRSEEAWEACPVKEDKIDARYHDGVLTVTVPKAEAAKARKIEIKT